MMAEMKRLWSSPLKWLILVAPFVLAFAVWQALIYGQEEYYCFFDPMRQEGSMLKVYRERTGKFPADRKQVQQHLSPLLGEELGLSPCVTSVQYKQEAEGFTILMTSESWWFRKTSSHFTWKDDPHAESIRRNIEFNESQAKEAAGGRVKTR